MNNIQIFDDNAQLSSFRAIFGVAVPAAVLNAAQPITVVVQASLLGRYAGTNALGAFGAVSITVQFGVRVFNFLVDGVSAKTGKSVGLHAWSELTGRIRMSLGFACVAGWVASCIVATVKNPVSEHVMELTPEVQAEAHYYWWVRIVMMPLVLINMSLSGILQGFRQMKAVAAINSGQALLEMAGSALVLTGYLGIDPANGLFCMGLCSLITQVLQLFVGMAAVLFLPPPEAHGQYSLMRELFGDKPDDSGALSEPLMSSVEPEVANHNDSASGHVNGVKHLDKVYGNGSAKDEEISRDVVSSTLAPQTPGASTAALDASISAAQTDTDYELDPENEPESLFSFVSDGLNMFVRSMILQTTFFTALVAASRLGTPSLAAHCIVNQLWQLISYAVDGFAAAGIVLGSRLAAQAHDPHLAADARVHLKRIIFRVLNAGLLFGLAAGLVFGIFRRRVIGMFTSDVATIQVLSGGVWGILCLSQPLNGLVFVYDGLMYASQSFTFIRNYISLGFLVVFCPILAVHAVVGETLAGVWLANAAFNAWRVAGAAYLIHWIFMDEFDALSVRGASTQSLLLDADVDEEVGTVRR